MFELVKSGGWLMLPIILCSVISVSIIVERFWSLQRETVLPRHLVASFWHMIKTDKLEASKIEEVGRQVVHKLERYLNTLGTIASITPLLGLLGTVIGMIKVFTAIMLHGVGDPAVLAGGISEALITTAAGLSVAIPSLMFHRYFNGLIDRLADAFQLPFAFGYLPGPPLELDADAFYIGSPFVAVPGDPLDADVGDSATEAAVALYQHRVHAFAGRSDRCRQASSLRQCRAITWLRPRAQRRRCRHRPPRDWGTRIHITARDS